MIAEQSRFATRALLSLILALPVFGDVVVHYTEPSAIGFSWPHISLVPDAGTPRKVVDAAPAEGDMLLTPEGTLFVASNLYPNVAVYAPNFAPVGEIVTPEPTAFLAMDATRLLYVVARSGTVRRFRSDGTPVDSFSLDPDGEIAAGDLGIDSCTLYHLDTEPVPHLRRFNLCRQTRLPDLGNVGVCSGSSAPLAAVRAAADGAILVAGCVRVYRFSNDGLRTYALPGSVAIAPTSDARFFWTGGGNQLSLIDAASGEVVRSAVVSSDPSAYVSAIEIAGAPRASLAATSEIPTLSPTMLAALAIVLAAIAMRAKM